MDYETANKLFTYNHETGELRNRISRGIAKAGQIAGCVRPDGYRQISGEGKFYLVHRVIWLIINGEWPEHEIDHINGVRIDNRRTNLRECTHIENARNRKIDSRNASGIMDVRFYAKERKWRSRITINGEIIHLLWTDDFFEACCARKAAENKYSYHPNHGRNS